MEIKVQDRYFLESFHDVIDMEHIIKKEPEAKVFQAVVRQSADIKRLTWFCLSNDINFERKSLGSGITIFYIDKTVPFFLKKKDKK